MFGGPKNEQIYAFQGQLFAYGRGVAAVDLLIDSDSDASDLTARDVHIQRIDQAIVGSKKIERAREQVAKALADLESPPVDHQG